MQARWSGSHHDAAMQVAGPDSVLGDFDDAELTHFGVTTRFRRDGDRYLVETEGPDGERGIFEVAYTFGVEPLQQYLVPFPGGRLQSFPLAWDTDRRRWFSLYPDERIPPGDPLYWTGPLLRWNSVCARCHSTGYERGYDVETDTYEPSSVSLDVACQACHGPGSEHVDWARTRGERPQTEGERSTFSTKSWTAVVEVERCAPCHSANRPLTGRSGAGEHFLDHYVPELLRPGFYHADGQIDGEVYVYGSFVQSKMYARGVRCSDCHDPHDLTLRAEGNALCTRCHAAEPDPRFPSLARRRYDTSEHHFHGDGSPGSRCVSCHMPEKNYMEVDGRRDHSLRIPRPDLSVRVGTPNACTGCHTDKDARWAADFLSARGAPEAAGHYGDVFAAARAGRPEATGALVDLASAAEQPAIVRATAVGMLAGPAMSDPNVVDAILASASAADALVRTVAAGALESAPPDRARRALLRLVADPVRSVRVEAARVLSGLPSDAVPANQRDAFHAALDEFREGQEALGDTPEAQLNLGVLHARRGRKAASEAAFRAALALQPDFVPARVNLANLLNSQGLNEDAVAQLRAGIASHERLMAGLQETPALRAQRGELHYSLGLVLAEMGDLAGAEVELARAAERIPERPRIRYNRALALQSLGRMDEAKAVLLELEASQPDDAEVQNALAVLFVQAGDRDSAARHAERLVELTNGAPPAVELLRQIRAGG